ncbi:MAG TPA: hypothetical protein VL484_07100 [Vicinamibacterales bacterium]|jgi:hypothetical protein|nr:hypothetical protein [Vicinamibacterales bacterium]
MTDTSDRPVDGAYALGIEMLDRGDPPSAVEQKLVEMGCTPAAASKIVSSYSKATAQAASSDGKTEMQFAAVTAGGGVLVLLYTGMDSLVGWFGLLAGGVSAYRGWSKRRGK